MWLKRAAALCKYMFGWIFKCKQMFCPGRYFSAGPQSLRSHSPRRKVVNAPRSFDFKRALQRRQCPFTEGWEVTRKSAPFWSKTWDTHSYWWNATAAYLRSTWRCSKHSAAIYYLSLGQQVVKWHYSLSLRNKMRKSKGKADVTPKGTRTVAAQELLPALPNRNTS